MTLRRKLLVLFGSSLLAMLAIAFWIELTDIEQSVKLQQERYLRISQELFRLLGRGREDRLKQKLEQLGYNLIPPNEAPQNASLLYRQPHSFGEIKLYRIGDRLYLNLNYLDRHLWLYDRSQDQLKNERMITFFLIAVDLTILVVIFFVLWRILDPLHRLAKKMRRFAAGERDLRLQIQSRDEIGDLARSFNTMAERLDRALRSKDELLRDVGHELRTPIAKGRFALESLPETPSREILRRSFQDLERLTGDIIQIQTLDDPSRLNYTHFGVETLIAEAVSLLYIEEECLQIDLDSFDIDGDLHYLSLALKNLIDNALKYRSQKEPVQIRASEGVLHISNPGENLGNHWETYLSAFTRKRRDHSGFGLGLNIIHKILTLHGYTLHYRHQDGINTFSIFFVTAS